MLSLGIVFILTLLALFQIDILPLNLAFTTVVALFLFSRADFSYVWLVLACLLVSLFANINLGLVIISFSAVLLVVDLLSRLFPENTFVKSLLLVGALFLSEFSLVTFGRLLS